MVRRPSRLLLTLALAVPGAAPGGVLHLDTTPATHVLFLDLLEVENLENAELVVEAAAKHPASPVLPLGDLYDWDALQARPWGGTLLYDREERLFKCWYVGIGHSRDLRDLRGGYATSRDGIAWEKPRLGLHEFGGGRDNNIVHPSGDLRVVKDPAEPDPTRRYQMLSARAGTAGKFGETYFPFYSSDGIHWTPGPDVQISPHIEIHQILFDPLERDPRRRIKTYGKLGKQKASKPGPAVVRKIAVGLGPDIEHQEPSPANPILDPDDGLEHELHFASVFPYRGYYLMLYNYNRYADYHDQGLWGRFVGDVRLAVSRDGEHFRRVNAHQPVIRRGERGTWDSGFLVMANAVDHDGRVYLYYSAGDESWGSWPADNAKPGRPTTRTLGGFSRSAQMGLALLPADGFTHLRARDGYGPGIATTVPIEVRDPARASLRLALGGGMPYRNWVEVEVLDAATGRPLPGFTRTDCVDLAGDGASLPVEWAGGRTTLADVGVPTIRLRFHLFGEARLRSFHFAGPP
ncbi:MAG: hypothetical protein JNG83_15270 [Opitutaceae bacterium]|nr:hypothetical protein [Opitutaceae bacterium]